MAGSGLEGQWRAPRLVAAQAGQTDRAEEGSPHHAREVEHLEELRQRLDACVDLTAKLAMLDEDERVQACMVELQQIAVGWEAFLALDSYEQYLLKSVAAIGQAHVLVVPAELDAAAAAEGLKRVVELARHLEQFYDVYGGLVGYQQTVLQLMDDAITAKREQEEAAAVKAAAIKAAAAAQGRRHPGSRFLPGNKNRAAAHGKASAATEADPLGRAAQHFHIPAGINLGASPEMATRAAAWGIAALPHMAEMYPVGGAGDRLGLVDEVTGEGLPAAMLLYQGRTMFEGLLRDLQAREYLYYRLYGQQHTTPVAVMTSMAKKNHMRLLALCEEKKWFGRGEGSFRLIQQSLVPVVTVTKGLWQRSGPLEVVVKPGGHGVLWKLARDEGVLEWFREQGRSATLVRQISNPMAGTDSTLLALAGMGQKMHKAMGFASCERRIGAAEGMNVLTERRRGDKWEYGVSNVEYTDFERLGVQDEGATPGSEFSKFPANTNILYVGLDALERALRQNSGRAALPGMLVNLTKKVESGAEQVCRLECSMQSVAENMMEAHDERLSASQWDKLSTFVTYNLRSKVTSSAKKKRELGSTKLAQTPDGSFITLQKNAAEILSACGMATPTMTSGAEFLERGPSYMVWLHPALGPLWDVIGQKITGGRLAERAELSLELAEVALENVTVEGSLRIHANDVMGHTEHTEDGQPLLVYSKRCGRCRLENVTVRNAGVDWSAPDNVFWQNRVTRKEQLSIVLEGNSEFDATDVAFRGAHSFVVPDGHRMVVRASAAAESGWEQELLPLVDGEPSWRWHYRMDAEDGSIDLHMEESVLYHEFHEGPIAAGGEGARQAANPQQEARRPRWRLAPWGRFRQYVQNGEGLPLGSRFGRRRRGKPPLVA